MSASVDSSKRKWYEPEIFIQFEEGDSRLEKWIGRLWFQSDEYDGMPPPEPTTQGQEQDKDTFSITFEQMIDSKSGKIESKADVPSSSTQTLRPGSDVNIRTSAAKKLLKWREASATFLEGSKRRGAWDITLEMGSPVGSMSIPNRWAEDIKALHQLLSNRKRGMVDSQIELKFDLLPHSYIAEGWLEKFIQEIRALRETFPENVRLTIDDLSVATVDPSIYYPPKDLIGPFYKMIERTGLRNAPEIETREHRRLRLQIGLLRWKGINLDDAYATASAQENERAMMQRAADPSSDSAQFNTNNIIVNKDREIEKIFVEWKDVTMNFIAEAASETDKNFKFCKEFLNKYAFD